MAPSIAQRRIPHEHANADRVAACPESLRGRIDSAFTRMHLLACEGLWTEAAHVFIELREACLLYQPKTVDPFELPLHETSIAPITRCELQKIGVLFLGQLQHVPAAELSRLRIGPKGMATIRKVCRHFGVKLRG